MGGGVFAGGPHVQQKGGLAGGDPALQFPGIDRSFGLRLIHNRDINI
jgi:hypothetical protein